MIKTLKEKWKLGLIVSLVVALAVGWVAPLIGAIYSLDMLRLTVGNILVTFVAAILAFYLEEKIRRI